MSYDLLVGSTSGISVTDLGNAQAEFEANREAMAAAVSRTILARPDLEQLVSADHHEMIAMNHHNHGRFISALMLSFEGKELVDTVLWVLQTYRAHGFDKSYWPIELKTWLDIMEKELSTEAFVATRSLYDWMLNSLPSLFQLAETSTEPNF
jgi:hypothetical protein